MLSLNQYILFNVLDRLNEYENNTNFDRNICSFIGYRVSNDEFSTARGGNRKLTESQEQETGNQTESQEQETGSQI